MPLGEKLAKYVTVIESEIELIPCCLQVVPFCTSGIICCNSFCSTGSINFVNDRHNMLSWVSVWSPCYCKKLAGNALHRALFLKLAQTGMLWVLSVVDKTSWEGVSPGKGRAQACD